MEEKINNIGEEQVSEVSVTVADARIEDVEQENNINNTQKINCETNENCSPYGKFKNADTLYKGYQDLQSEFTRKSQKLSELEKSIELDNVKKNTPIYDTENWQQELSAFLKKYKNASSFSKDISNEILSDKVLATSPNSLEIAYGRVLGKHYKTNDELIRDEKFLSEYVFNNKEIKEKIIKDYLKEIRNNNNNPLFVSSSKGAVTGVNNTPPKTLQEAKLMTEKLFNF